MKKAIAAALTLTLSLSMGTAVYAEGGSMPASSSADIKATYQTGKVKNDAVYSVDIEWGDLAYTYNSGKIKTWNPTELKYEIKENTTPTWSCAEGADKIKVTNNSNVGVTAKLSYSSEHTLVEGTFDHAKINLKSAEGTEAGKGPSGVATLALTGGMNESDSPASELGKVEITVGEFEGDVVTNESIITAPNLGTDLHATVEDGVFTASGTISNAEEIDLTHLQIGGVPYKMLAPNNYPFSMETAKGKVFEVDLAETTIGGTTICNKFRLYPKTGTYNYVLTINTNTKKVTVVLSE